MASDEIDLSLLRTQRKRAREEEEEEMDVILSIVAFIVTIIATMYHQNMVKKKSTNMELERRNWLNHQHASLELDDISADEAINTPTQCAQAQALASSSSQSTTKKRKREVEVVGAVVEMAESIIKYMSAKRERLCVREVYEEVSKLVDLTRAERLDACQRFISGKVEEFRLLKLLPDEDKKDWILLLLSRPLY